jgi:hypothetical protein
MTDKSKLNDVNRKKRKAEHAALDKAKNRIRIMNYLLGRANCKLNALFDLPEPSALESLCYDLGALEVIWRKHLAWLQEIGLEGVGPNDKTEVHDDAGDDDGGSYSADILEA